MARFKDKIEHKRLLKDKWGELLLQKLLSDGILSLKDNKFYHLNPERLDDLLGVNWIDLRKGKAPEKLIKYILSVE